MKILQYLNTLSYTGHISRLGFLLIAIAFFLTLISFTKGIQILIFIPAFVLSIFFYSLYELYRIQKYIRITLKSDKEGNYLQVFIKKGYKYNFILSNKTHTKSREFLEPDRKGIYHFRKDIQYDLSLYIFGSFDIFRLRRPVGNVFFTDISIDNDEYVQSEKYTQSKQIIRIDPLKTSLNTIPYIKETYTLQAHEYEESQFSIQSNDPLGIVSGEKLGKFHVIMIFLGMLAVSIEWISPILNIVMIFTGLSIFLLRKKRGKLSEKIKNIFLISAFVGMFILTWVLGDMSGPGSVFLLQILMIIYLFPRDFKNSFLYIFLILFVFVAVSLFSSQIWFILLFVTYLCISIYLLFYISGTESFDSGQYKIGNKISKKNFISAYISVVTIMLLLFILLPHGNASQSNTNIGSRNNQSYVSGFNEEISLENIKNIKEDRRKVIVVESIQLSEVESLGLLYFRGRRYNFFDGTKWEGGFSGKNFIVENSQLPADKVLSIKYYLGGSTYIYMPAAPVFISGTNVPFGNFSNDRTILRSYFGVNEPLSLQIGFKTLGDGKIIDAGENKLVFSTRIDEKVEDIFAEYIAGIPDDITQSPQALSNYVQNNSGFRYDTFDVAKNISDFLYGKKVGHCEYYATTLAVVLQHFGFTPTFVSGFGYGEYNALADSYIVRASNAHTWVELYNDDTGVWEIYDPTPGASLSARQFMNTSLERIIEIYDYIDIKWYTYIVNYTKDEQKKVYIYIISKFLYIIYIIVGVFAVGYIFKKISVIIKFLSLSKREKIIFLLSRKYGSPQNAILHIGMYDVLQSQKIEKYLFADIGNISLLDIIFLLYKK